MGSSAGPRDGHGGDEVQRRSPGAHDCERRIGGVAALLHAALLFCPLCSWQMAPARHDHLPPRRKRPSASAPASFACWSASQATMIPACNVAVPQAWITVRRTTLLAKTCSSTHGLLCSKRLTGCVWDLCLEQLVQLQRLRKAEVKPF